MLGRTEAGPPTRQIWPDPFEFVTAQWISAPMKFFIKGCCFKLVSGRPHGNAMGSRWALRFLTRPIRFPNVYGASPSRRCQSGWTPAPGSPMPARSARIGCLSVNSNNDFALDPTGGRAIMPSFSDPSLEVEFPGGYCVRAWICEQRESSAARRKT